MIFKLFRKHKAKLIAAGGIEEKKEAIRKTNATADRINDLCDKFDMRWHDIPVTVDRRKPA